jgi:hypothetical protein
MSYSLNKTRSSYPNPNFADLWPKHLTTREGKTIFYFKDEADYLLQRKNDPLVRSGIKIRGIDY